MHQEHQNLKLQEREVLNAYPDSTERLQNMNKQETPPAMASRKTFIISVVGLLCWIVFQIMLVAVSK